MARTGLFKRVFPEPKKTQDLVDLEDRISSINRSNYDVRELFQTQSRYRVAVGSKRETEDRISS